MMIDLTIIGTVLRDFGIIVATAAVRSFTGWAAKALKDNRVTKFEMRQLLQTIIRVGTIGIFGYIGLSVVGIDNAMIASAVGAFFADKILNALKQTKPIRQ